MNKEIIDATSYLPQDALQRFNNMMEAGVGQRLDIKLSEHFMLSEFVKTKYYQSSNYIPTQKIFNNIAHGVKFILEPLRVAIDEPIIITSGYRCPITNSCVGGHPKSQHRRGQAVDITIHNTYRMEELLEYAKKLPFDQILSSTRYKFLHISWTDKEYCAEGRKSIILDYYD